MNGTSNGVPNGGTIAAKPRLVLVHPTPSELVTVWAKTANEWGKALGTAGFLERENYLYTQVPLNTNGGLTYWILVDDSLPPDNRPILASCESLRKAALIRSDGVTKEVLTHGIGSVFCDPVHRGKGYGGTMLKLLGPMLRDWQTEQGVPGRESCPFSILYSDIGKKFYAKHGWHPHPAKHFNFAPSPLFVDVSATSVTVEKITKVDQARIKQICQDDVARLKQIIAVPGRPAVAVLPDYQQMQWHHMREDFVTQKLFDGKSPDLKGASCFIGDSRITALWTRSYYGPLEDPKAGNALHILRLIVDNALDADQNSRCLKAILQLAQDEAHKWKSQHVEIWNPSEYVQDLVDRTGIKYQSVDRETESIPSLMWYGPDGNATADDLDWLYNEKFGWS